MDSSACTVSDKKTELSAEGVGFGSFPTSSPNYPTGSKKSTSLDFLLLGKGKKGKCCGEIFPRLSCQICAKIHVIRCQCKRKLCPDCYQKWLDKTTKIIVSTHLPMLEKKIRIVHVVLSPPQKLTKKCKKGEISYQQLRELTYDYFYKKCKYKPTGVLIFHPFRPNKRYYKERGEERGEGDDNPNVGMKKWHWIMIKENWYDYTKDSYHFHFVGSCYLDPPKKGEDFKYKMIRNREGDYTGVKNKSELYRLVYYLLSHTGAPKNDKHFSSYTWLGNVSYRFDKVKKINKTEKRYRCKICRGILRPLNENLRAFGKTWINQDVTPFLGRPNCKDAKFIKRKFMSSDAPQYIKLNVCECIDVILDKKPPPDYEKFLV